MKRTVFRKDPLVRMTVMEDEEAVPQHGVDFCANCGRCLCPACSGEHDCAESSWNGEHYWAIRREENEDA
jgi:hypothetical protein